MVDVTRVWEVADGQRAAKVDPVTVRSVWRGLGSKGSFEDLAPMVAAWKAAKDYRPAVELSGLPETLQKRLIDFGASVLEMARAEEAEAIDAERANMEAERRAYREVAAEASATVDMLEARVADLQAEVAFLRSLLGKEDANRGMPADRQPEEASPPDTDASSHLGDPSDSFWASVSAQVQVLLAERGPMSADALLSALPEAIRECAVRVGPPLTRGTLGHHLRRSAVAFGDLDIHDGLFGPHVGDGEDKGTEETAPAATLGRNVESTAFWRGVMVEIVTIIRRDGPLTATEIVERLSPTTVADADRFQRILPGMLAFKMRGRIIAKVHFVEVDGRFGLRDAAPPDIEERAGVA